MIPRTALDAPVPPREEAMKQLICRAARACGVGTFADITGYFYVDRWWDRLPPGPRWAARGRTSGRDKPIAKRLVSELVEEQRLVPVRVEGWKDQAYVHPDARVPRSVDARAFVTPFDSLVWDRDRVERLFGMKYVLEIYVPPPKRQYGYYVFPFLLAETLVARCDLKADRERRMLMVQSAFLENGQSARRVVPELQSELRQLQAWLGLDGIEVARCGDLAERLRRSISQRRA